MKYTKFLLTAALGTAAVLASPAAAFARDVPMTKDVPAKSEVRPELTLTDRERFALRHLQDGRTKLAKAATLRSNAAKLNKLDQAVYSLRRARTEAMKGKGQDLFDIRALAERNLVGALDDQGEIYISRGSLRTAEKRVDAALAVAPYDERTLALKDRIDFLQARGSYDYGGNAIADRRIANRRGADAAAPSVTVEQGTTPTSPRDAFSKVGGVSDRGPGGPARNSFNRSPAGSPRR